MKVEIGAEAVLFPEKEYISVIFVAVYIPVKELHGLSTNFHIHVSVSDLYSIFPGLVHIFSCSRIGIPILGIYKSFTDTLMWKLGLRPCNSFSGNIFFEFSLQCGHPFIGREAFCLAQYLAYNPMHAGYRRAPSMHVLIKTILGHGVQAFD